MTRFLLRLALLLVCASGPAAAQSPRCEVALVLAFDVSRSVDTAEFLLMRDGTAAAFLAPDIQALIGLAPGGIMVTVTQWSDAERQEQVLPWQHLATPDSIRDFAARLGKLHREFDFSNTAPGNALLHAGQTLRTNPNPCRRRVIDIAGDGVGNSGLLPAEVADRFERQGVTINGLVIRGAQPDPLSYYQTRIMRGPGAFVEAAEGYEDFARAFRLKLARELAPSLSWLNPAPAPKPRPSPQNG
jgi:hypothetical protein